MSTVLANYQKSLLEVKNIIILSLKMAKPDVKFITDSSTMIYLCFLNITHKISLITFLRTINTGKSLKKYCSDFLDRIGKKAD